MEKSCKNARNLISTKGRLTWQIVKVHLGDRRESAHTIYAFFGEKLKVLRSVR